MDTRKTHTKGRKFGRMSRRERDALITILPDVKISPESVLDKTAVFGREAPLYLEIGFGAGTFLVEKAAAAPHCDFIGIEIYMTGIAKLLVNLTAKDNPDSLSITNVRIFNAEARSVLINNIPPGSLDGVYILFPDPWPKKRHNKRRLINPEFARILSSKLTANGFIVVATDSGEYAAEIESSFTSAGFRVDSEDLAELSSTTYALKAFQKKSELRGYRFVNGNAHLSE